MAQWAEFMQHIEELTSSYFQKHESHLFCVVKVTTKTFYLWLYFFLKNTIFSLQLEHL